MKRLLSVLALCLALAACGGIPLRALPRLAQFSQNLLIANPAEFMVALQVDARLVPPPGAVPQLVLKLTPRNPGAFAPIDKKLPLQLAVAAGAGAGLEAPGPGRRWLIYSLPAATQAELRQIQATIKAAQAASTTKGGGSLAVGVEQDALANNDPSLANTRWQTWLQTQKNEGFYEVWSGSQAEVLRRAAEARR